MGEESRGREGRGRGESHTYSSSSVLFRTYRFPPKSFSVLIKSCSLHCEVGKGSDPPLVPCIVDAQQNVNMNEDMMRKEEMSKKEEEERRAEEKEDGMKEVKQRGEGGRK